MQPAPRPAPRARPVSASTRALKTAAMARQRSGEVRLAGSSTPGSTRIPPQFTPCGRYGDSHEGTQAPPGPIPSLRTLRTCVGFCTNEREFEFVPPPCR